MTTIKRIVPILAVSAVVAFTGVRLVAQHRKPRVMPFQPGDWAAIYGFERRQADLNRERGEFFAMVRRREGVSDEEDFRYDGTQQVFFTSVPPAPVDSNVAAVNSAR